MTLIVAKDEVMPMETEVLVVVTDHRNIKGVNIDKLSLIILVPCDEPQSVEVDNDGIFVVHISPKVARNSLVSREKEWLCKERSRIFRIRYEVQDFGETDEGDLELYWC